MSAINKVKIVCEEAYLESVWIKRLLNGLAKELKKRRIVYEQMVDIKEIFADDSVCILGMNSVWTENLIEKCNQSGCIPVVLSCQSKRNMQGQYHLICSDIRSTVLKLKDVFTVAGRNRIALYGSGYLIDLDKDRTENFAHLVSDPSDIYTNTGNLENCFRSFYPKAARYDAVVCVNGYAAVSLVKKLEKENSELLEKMVILSFEEVLKHSKYNQWLSIVDLNLESYGAVVITVLEMFDLRNDVSEITIKMNAKVCDIPKKEEESCSYEAESMQLYEDPEIIHMAKIEQILRDADDLDHHIIAMLLDNAKYSDIADSCYMTEGNIKYRVKKYMSICGCKTKKELLELLQEYLQ